MQPLSYLETYGAHVDSITRLLWGVLFISISVTLIITFLVLVGACKRRSRASIAETRPQDGGPGLTWITTGVSISAVFLVLTVIWTVKVVANVGPLPHDPTLIIDVTGEQWWWRARYASGDPTRVFMTANEIHIPVGQPVLVRLHAADVIHSFWVPQLTGKTDAIPGQMTETWIEAAKPGRFQGQCTEFCGLQHAHMGLVVVADTPSDFAEWQAAQLAPALVTDAMAAGAQRFTYRCGACHTVRGTEAGGTVAPDLTHLMSRHTIAAGTLPNNVANLSAWMVDPQGIKPGTNMPDLGLSGSETEDIRNFLITLK